MKRSLLLATLALLLLPASSDASVIFTFEGTTPDTFVDVRFTAELTISGDDLTIVLTNDSLNHSNGASPSLNPNDLLTSFYFDIFNGVSRPTLTWTSAVGDVYQGVKNGADTLVLAGADLMAGTHQSWDFKQGLTYQPGSDLLTFGIGGAGNNSLIPNGFDGSITDGPDYGIYAGDVSTQNLTLLLVKDTATFMFSGLTGYSEADIADEALFGLGTQPDSTGFVPEPGSLGLLGVGVLGLVYQGRRSKRA